MKRSNIGIKDIATFENAEDAYRKARKCKRYREEVLRFTDNLEEELYDLVADLEAGIYRQLLDEALEKFKKMLETNSSLYDYVYNTLTVSDEDTEEDILRKTVEGA